MAITDPVIESVAEFIVRECREFNSKIVNDIRRAAPETTPKNIEIRLGNAYYSAQHTDYKSYMQAALYSYLKHKNAELHAPKSQDLYDSIIKEGFLDWNNSLANAGGTSMPGENFIWVAFLPDSFEKQLAKDVKRFTESKNHNENVFANFVRSLSQRGKVSTLHRTDRTKYIATTVHEVTHLIIKQETHLGRLYHEHEISDEDLNRDIQFILGEADGLSNSEQASEIGNNKYLSAIDEAFAFFIGDKIKGNLSETDKSRFERLYDHPQAISWSYNILLERYGKNISIDNLRRLELQIFEEIAQRGQVQKNSGYRNPLVYMLKFTLPEQDKILVNGIRAVCEEDLAHAFRNLHTSINNIKSKSRNIKIVREFKTLEKKVDWDNPRELEDFILHHVLEKSVGKNSLEQTSKILREKVRSELQIIQNMIIELKNLETGLNSSKLDKELVDSIKELSAAEKEIEKLLKQA